MRSASDMEEKGDLIGGLLAAHVASEGVLIAVVAHVHGVHDDVFEGYVAVRAAVIVLGFPSLLFAIGLAQIDSGRFDRPTEVHQVLLPRTFGLRLVFLLVCQRESGLLYLVSLAFSPVLGHRSFDPARVGIVGRFRTGQV